MLYVETPSGRWAAFCARVKTFLLANIADLNVDGRRAQGFRTADSPAVWIRDHADMTRGGKFFEPWMQDVVSLFAEYQSANGRVFDYVTTEAGTEPENWEKWVRVPVEADVEYRFVQAAYTAWQATGDDAWMKGILPHLERALTYTHTHPWRWDDEHGLVKRAYTIDTWDFDYTAGRHPWLNFQITDHTFWGIMHGDVSGFYHAAGLLARLYRHAGQDDDAARWEDVAAGVRERANRLLFNGRFYTHFYKLTPMTFDGVDEAEQLSLSNPMAINRGLATGEIATAILDEYRRRRETTGAFAEWFSIDPPFPSGSFGDEKLVQGAYVNGGIMPLVGGELARAAFEHGREAYGLATLEQYARMIEETGETYLWYFPDGRPSTVETSTSPDAQPTDGWGGGAMLYAFVEGLCGIEDRAHSYRQVRCAPRWAATDEEEATVRLSYAASGAGFGYRYRHDAGNRRIVLELEAEEADVDLHLLMPSGTRPQALRWDGQQHACEPVQVGESLYVDARHAVRGGAVVEVTYADA